jgi:hypothetical protein
MTRLSTPDIDYLIGFNSRWLDFLTAEKASTSIKVTIADAIVLPNALEARLKLSLSGSPRNTVIGSWLTRNGVGTNEGTNYLRASGKFIFHPGEATEQDIVIQLKGNNAPGKTIEVVLSSTIAGASVARQIGKITFSDTVPSGVKSGFAVAYETNFIDGFQATDTGLAPDGSPCWQSRPAHGRTQPGNKELGLYVDPALYPATDPIPIVSGKRILRSEHFPDGVLDAAGKTTLCPWRPVVEPTTKEVIGYEPFKHTASMITSRKLRTVTVGDRVEARFAMPVLGERAAWPAFWLMPMPPFNWPPEIDMMEWPINSGHNAWTFYTTQHWSSAAGSHQQLGYPIDIRALGITEDLTAFHTFGIELGAQRLVFDIDGKKTVEMENRAPTASWYVLLNMALGGSWPGDPTTDTTFPCDMALDWIRFYKPT